MFGKRDEQDSRSQTNTSLNANKHWLGEMNIFEEEEKEIVMGKREVSAKGARQQPITFDEKVVNNYLDSLKIMNIPPGEGSYR